MRTKKPTKGRVAGIKFTLNEEKKEESPKEMKARLLEELEEKEKNNKEWYDKEMDKNLGKQ